MTCSRCSGLMVTESVLDLSENKHGSWTYWHCVNCGHATDPVMEQNRALVKAKIWPKGEGRHGSPYFNPKSAQELKEVEA